MYNTKRSMGMGILILSAAFSLQACSKMDSLSKNSVGASTSSVTPSSVTMQVTDQTSSALVFADTTTNKTFTLTAGKSYNVAVSSSNLPLGSTVDFVAVNTSLPGSATQTLSAAGNQITFTPATAGDYSIKIVVKAYTGDKLLTKDYAAGVGCQTPTFTSNSLSASGISVSPLASANLYSFSAAAAISGANGQAPYLCAFDFTGVGIVDTGFTDCATAVTNYAALVQTRNVGVVVKDACNTAYTISKNVNLAATTPAMPGNVFIQANVSAEAGTATSDVRIKGVHYLSTNVTGYTPVQPGYGGTNFVIQSFFTYPQTSSVSHGMKIEVSGLAGSFNLRTNINGTIDTSAATVSKVTYITDQAGDQNPSVSLTSTTCTTTGIHAQLRDPVGKPCSSGTTPPGTENNATVEVWGDYVCTSASSAGGGASVTLTGTFDGYTHIADSCQGGGGGGGGIVPIKL